jgi:hypothetical protein
MFARLAAMQYSYPLLIDDGVVPFHQPCAGSVVSTVSVPDWAGLMEMLFFLLVTLQSPKLPPEDLLDEEPDDDPHAATGSVSARAAVRASVRLRCIESLSGSEKRSEECLGSRLAARACRVKDIGVTIEQGMRRDGS